MIKLSGQHIKLRALEPSDLDFLYALENDTEVWGVSETLTPFSRFVLEEYLANAHRDIYEVKQLRLIITGLNDIPMGCIDLFDFDPKNERAGVGIIISDKQGRGKGYAKEAIDLLSDYAFAHLHIHQLYANIAEDNENSIALFSKLGFKEIGIKKDWLKTSTGFKDEILFQKIKE